MTSQAATPQSAILNMVQCQLAPNGIRNDLVLQAFLSVDRTHYLPESLKTSAAIDDCVGDREGSVLLLRPVILALMIQHLVENAVQLGRIAVIGDGSGYISDILAQLGFTGIDVADAGQYESEAPWDGVIINGCVIDRPDYLFSGLARGACVLTILRPDHAAIGDIVALSPEGKIILGQGSAPYCTAIPAPSLFFL